MQHINRIIIVFLITLAVGVVLPKLILRDSPNISPQIKECVRNEISIQSDSPVENFIRSFGSTAMLGQVGNGVVVRMTTIFGIPLQTDFIECNGQWIAL